MQERTRKLNQRFRVWLTGASFLWLAVLSVSAMAKEAASLYVDNDSRLLKPNHNTDRHYTNGTKLVYLMQPDWQWLEDFSHWHFADDGQPVDTAVGVFLGQHIYTPNYIDRPEMRTAEDRRYAGWLYTGLFAQRATADVLDHIELNVGVIGPSSHVEESQENLHKWLGGSKPVGWDDQMADEPTADVTVMRQQRLTDGFFAPTELTDVIAEVGFTAGSVNRFAQAGLLFRYGFNLEGTFGPGRLNLPSGVSSLRKDTSSRSGYLFARVSGKAIEHNRFLTGLDHEPLMAELQVGFVYQVKQLEFSYSQTHMTQEFEEQAGVDSYGTVTVSWLF